MAYKGRAEFGVKKSARLSLALQLPQGALAPTLMESPTTVSDGDCFSLRAGRQSRVAREFTEAKCRDHVTGPARRSGLIPQLARARTTVIISGSESACWTGLFSTWTFQVSVVAYAL